MPSLTSNELAALVGWFESAELPPPPFRTAPWSEVATPEEWRAVTLRDLHHGPTAIHWYTALLEVRWLAKRIAPPDVQAAAHTDELVERHGPAF